MDWKYKTFNHQAVYNALPGSVLEAARAVVAESLQSIEEQSDGFVARGSSGWRAAVATVRVAPLPNGAQLTVELQVERAAGGVLGYMLWDAGDFYTGRIDKWFRAIAQRLGGPQEHLLVSTSTTGLRVRQGCLRGCLAYLLVGACLSVFAIPLDHALLPQLAGSDPGPLTVLVGLAALLLGVGVCLYVMYPDAPLSQSIKQRLSRGRNTQ
jgi:hypothetical protein